MAMTMTTSMNSMSTSTAMSSMPTSTAAMSSMATSSSMMMAFNTENLSTMLYSSSWMPTTIGHYVGTWFFLFFLSIIWRGLVSVLAQRDRHWAHKHSTYEIRVKGGEELAKAGNPVWRWSVNLPRAALAMVNQGIGYLLYEWPSLSPLLFLDDG
jgi:copper transporter 1